MMRTRFFRLGTIAVLAGALPSCSSTEENKATGDVHPVLGVAMEGLGATVASCNNGSNVGASGNFDSAAKTMTVTLEGGSTVFSVIDNAVTINGWSCFDEAGTTALTTSNVRKLNITTSGSGDKVVFDLLPGSFDSIFTSSGGVTVDMTHATDSVAIRGSSAANKMKAGQHSAGTALYLEVSGDNNADIKLSGVGLPDGTDDVTFLLGAGNDTFTGTGGTVTANHIDSVTSLVPVAMTKLVVYGGDGNDTLQGGDGDDTMYGGAGDDTFLTAEDDDGSDSYYGGADEDTMSYAARTDAVVADINPGTVTATGSVNLWSLTYPIAASTDLTVDAGGGARTISLAGIATPALVADAINTGLTADSGTAYLNSMNQVVMQHASADIVVTSTGGGSALLGITDATYTGLDADDGKSGEADDIMSDVENLIGGAGNDTLVGSAGPNNIEGGDGDDTISGGIGGTCSEDVDLLEGEDGDDTFRMGPAANCGDDVRGGAGTDTVDYQYRSEVMTVTVNTTANDGDGGASENDNIRTDNETIIGGTGDDVITGGSGDETFHGGPGDDTINGGSGDDTLIGNSGDDILNGDGGDDLFETAGEDSVFVGLRSWEDDKGDGDDVMNGGAGTDKVSYDGRTTVVTATMCTDTSNLSGNTTSTHAQCVDTDGGPAIARLQGDTALTSGTADGQSLTVNIGGSDIDVTFASDTTAALVAARVEAAVTGLTVVADAENKLHMTLTANDLTAKSITLTGSGLAALGFGTTATVTAAKEGDEIINAEWLIGGDDVDNLTGHTADETIEGGAGADVISGGEGDDMLYGDLGNDTVSGDAGDDLVNGGAGDDTLQGGAGDGDICTEAGGGSADAACEVL